MKLLDCATTPLLINLLVQVCQPVPQSLYQACQPMCLPGRSEHLVNPQLSPVQYSLSPDPCVNEHVSLGLPIDLPRLGAATPDVNVEAASPVVLDVPPHPHCDPVLDINGQCNCSSLPGAHVPNLPSLPGHAFPKCREKCLRLLYIDDALLATSIVNTQLKL